MPRPTPSASQQAKRIARDQRAFELVLAGHTLREASAIMIDEGYKQCAPPTISRLAREYGESIILPLAKEHVTREFERLMQQRVRLDKQMARAWEICERFHFATNNQGVIQVVDPVTGEVRPVQDSGPELQALKVMQGIEQLVISNGQAMAKMFGFGAPDAHTLTVTTEVDAAVAALVGEMNSRSAADQRGVRA